MQGTARAVLDKCNLRHEGGDQYRGSSPLRAGSDSDAFVLTITDDEHGTYYDHVSGESGSLYELAKELGVALPRTSNGSDPEVTKRGYQGLKDYADVHHVTVDVFERARWKEVAQHGRPALQIPTANGVRWRFLDGKKPTYISSKGYKACWYGLGRAVRFVVKSQQSLIICNGEASTVVGQSYKVAACAITAGEKPKISDQLLSELKAAYQGPILVAFDCDKTGRAKAPQLAAQLRAAGFDAKAIDLDGGIKGYDLADFCGTHGRNSAKMLQECKELTAEGVNQAKNSASEEVSVVASIIKELQTLKDDEQTDTLILKQFAAEQTDACAQLDRTGLLEVSAALQNAGLSKTWLTREWQPAVRERAKQIKIKQREKRAREKTSMDTYPYSKVDNTIVYISERETRDGVSISEKTVCEFSARITEEIADEENKKHFKIEGNTNIRSFDFTISVEDFTSERLLKAALTAEAGARYPIHARMATHLAPAIQKLTTSVKQIKRFKRTGWHKGRYLIPGREQAGEEIVLSQKLVYDFRSAQSANFNEAKTALYHLLTSVGPERSMPAFIFLLQAPLAQLAGWRDRRYCLFIRGTTGTMKSAWSKLAMCFYGPEFNKDASLIKWGEGATNNSIMKLATSVRDATLFIDNYKPNTGGGARAFVGLIHNILEGTDKNRLTITTELRRVDPIYAWPLSTGEGVPSSDAASLARMLVIDWPKVPTGLPDIKQGFARSEHLCLLGSKWIDWLESPQGYHHATLARNGFSAIQDQYVADFQRNYPHMVNPLRVATSLAVNRLTFMVACNHPTIGPLLQPFAQSYMNGIDRIAAMMANRTSDALEANRFIDSLRELLDSGRALLLKPEQRTPDAPSDKDRHIGWLLSNGTVYLIPNISRQLVEKHWGKNSLNQIGRRTLYSQLDGLGMIAEKGKSQATIRKTVFMNFRTRVLVIKPGVLTDTFPETDFMEE